MKLRNTLIFALILLLLGAYVYVVEVRQAGEKEKAEEEAKRVVSVDWDAVDTIRLENEHGKVELRRDVKAGGEGEADAGGDEEEASWRITAPIEADADQATVRSLVTTLKDLKRDQVVAEAPDDPARFGLDAPPFTVSVGRAIGEEYTVALHVGDKSPVGSNSYIQVKGEPAVLLASADLEVPLDKKLFDLREKRVVAFQRTDLQRLRVTSEKGAVGLEKKGTTWRLTEPIEARAAEVEVNPMITALTSLRIESFREEMTDDLARYGLDAPRMTVDLTLGDDRAVKQVLLGKAVEGNPGRIFAKRAEKPQVYVVDAKVYEDLDRDAETLRDRKVLAFQRYEVKSVALERPGAETIALTKDGGKWRLESPIEARADSGEVSKLLSALADLEAKAFLGGGEDRSAERGFAPARATITLTKDESEVVARFMVGKEQRSDRSVYLRNDLDGTDVLVSAEFTDQLPGEASSLRASKVLDFPRYRVEAIDVAVGEETLVLEKDDDGRWEMKAPEKKEVDRTKVDDFLSALSSVEAKEFIAADETSFPLYGLVKPNVVITLSSKDREEELARLLVGGRLTDSEDVYVKWVTEPWVSVVDGAFVTSLPSGPETFTGAENGPADALDTSRNDG